MLAPLVAVAAPLATTVCIETPIAALLGLRGRQLGAVVAVNFVTNPIVNLVALLLSGLPKSWSWSLLGALEVMVVVAEWRLLVWALGTNGISSRKLLAASIAMNAASATLGTYLLALVL